MGDFLRSLCKVLVVAAIAVLLWQFGTSGKTPRDFAYDLLENAGIVSVAEQTVPAAPPASIAPDSAEAAITSEALMNETNLFAYSNLAGVEKVLYRELLEGVANHEACIDITPIDESFIQPCTQAVINDHPELFYWDGSANYQMSSKYDMKAYSVEPNYSLDEANTAAVATQLDAVYASFAAQLASGADEYDKVLAAYTYIIDTTDYKLGATHSQTLEGALVDRKAVCAGYARAFEYLLQRSGVECGYVTGEATSSIMDGPHAWNIVHLDGIYTYVDCTWGDPLFINPDGSTFSGISYEYLCVGTETLFATHTPDNPATLPHCVDYTG